MSGYEFYTAILKYTQKNTARFLIFKRLFVWYLPNKCLCCLYNVVHVCYWTCERTHEKCKHYVSSSHQIDSFLFFFFYFFNKHKMHPRYAFLNTNSTLCKHKRVTIAPPRIRRAYLRVYLNIFVVSTPCTVILLYFFFCRYITVTRV